MPLYNKATSLSLPPSRGGDEQKQQNPQHPLKRKQPVSFDETVTPNNSGSSNKNDGMLNKDLSKNRLIRSNDLNPLIQSSTETLLDMLKAYAGIKECSDETQVHLNMVMYKLVSTNVCIHVIISL
jgi:hypothetical protein